MRTTKPISTISYNSPEFLSIKMNELFNQGIISFWCAVIHKPEEDELKPHIHLYIEPNTKVDTMELQKLTIEIDPENPDKPWKCVDFRSSKWDDWLLYVLHDPVYLFSKGETRKYHYDVGDFFYCDEDEFFTRHYDATHSGVVFQKTKFFKGLLDNRTFEEMCLEGSVPLQLTMQSKVFSDTYRRARSESERESREVDKLVKINSKLERELLDIKKKYNLFEDMSSENASLFIGDKIEPYEKQRLLFDEIC